MPYNSNTLFQKIPDKVSFFYAQMSEKWLELSLKKFPSYIFRNNVESETVLYLTNGRKRGWDKSPSLSIVFGLSSKTQWLSGLYYADFISFYSPAQLCRGGTTKSNSNELTISVPLSKKSIVTTENTEQAKEYVNKVQVKTERQRNCPTCCNLTT